MKTDPAQRHRDRSAQAARDERTPDEPDHVDRVRAQWRAVCPELDTSPIEVVARIGRVAAYFDQSTNALMGQHGLARGSWDVLASLRRAGPPYELSPTELYRELMRTSGAMTNRLHRLEQAGLIERRRDPGDGRGVVVRLTTRGRKLVDKLAPLHMDNEQRMLTSLSDSDRHALAGLLRGLARDLEEAHSLPEHGVDDRAEDDQ